MTSNPGAVHVGVDGVDVLGEVYGLFSAEGSLHIEGLTEVELLACSLGIFSVVDLEHVLDGSDTRYPLLESREDLVHFVKGGICTLSIHLDCGLAQFADIVGLGEEVVDVGGLGASYNSSGKETLHSELSY